MANMATSMIIMVPPPDPAAAVRIRFITKPPIITVYVLYSAVIYFSRSNSAVQNI